MFGNLESIFLWGNLIYRLRVRGDIPGMIPYLGCFGIAACFFAGIYMSYKKRITLLTLFPLIVVFIDAVAAVGRGAMLIGFILFLSGAILIRNPKGIINIKHKYHRWKTYLSFLLILIIIVAGAEFIRNVRKAGDSYKGTSSTLKASKGMVLISPAVYLYFSVHNGVFNQYLRHENLKSFWGEHTFSPLWHILNKIGFNIQTNPYQPAQRTPVGANTGTYLIELHSDFGPIGIVIGPLIYGILCTIFWLRLHLRPTFFSLACISHLLVIVFMSYIASVTQLGYFFISLFASMIGAYYLDRNNKRLLIEK